MRNSLTSSISKQEEMGEALKSKHILLTLFTSTLLVGSLIIFHSSAFSSVTGRRAKTRLETSISRALKTDKCDIFTGKWIPDPSRPAYTNETCHHIPTYVDCMTNGRPDRGYLHWKWKPDGCELPPFDELLFLSAMRNKNFAVIGDSIAENHFDTILCLLSKAEEPVLDYRDKAYHYRRWRFFRYNFTISIIWSPMLAQAEDTDGKSSNNTKLHLDTLDTTWTDDYHRFDYVVLSTGQWFLLKVLLLENGTIIGCNYCPGMNLPELGMANAFSRVLRSVLRFIADSDHKPVVLYRAWSPTHYDPQCNRTRPYREGEYYGTFEELLMRGVEMEELGKAAAEGIGERLKVMNTYHLAMLRPDGHPGPYRTFETFSGHLDDTDCTHWCSPGAIDSWNDLLMYMLFGGGESSSNL